MLFNFPLLCFSPSWRHTKLTEITGQRSKHTGCPKHECDKERYNESLGPCENAENAKRLGLEHTVHSASSASSASSWQAFEECTQCEIPVIRN